MNTVWKVILGLALVVPMGAYVAGSLAASASGDPEPRHTIQIRQSDPTPTHSPSSPSSTPSDSRSTESGDDEVEVITPEYDDLGDDHGGEDHSGSGDSGSGGGDGGGGDHSGHGHGGGDD